MCYVYVYIISSTYKFMHIDIAMIKYICAKPSEEIYHY